VHNLFHGLQRQDTSTSLTNPWPAARGGLNEIAKSQLLEDGTTLSFQYNTIQYTLTPHLSDAEQVAVFFDRYISDHLPVYVSVTI